jgi:hypothetical protein
MSGDLQGGLFHGAHNVFVTGSQFTEVIVLRYPSCATFVNNSHRSSIIIIALPRLSPQETHYDLYDPWMPEILIVIQLESL